MNRYIFATSILSLAALCLGCDLNRPDPKAEEAAQRELRQEQDRIRAVNSLYEHLRINRWCRPLSAQTGSQYKEAQIVYRCQGQDDKVVARLSLGSNVAQDGVLEILLEGESDKQWSVFMAFTETKPFRTLTRRADGTVEREFACSLGTFDYGYQDEEWPELTLLKAGNGNGGATAIDDPKNREQVLLRFVK